MSIFRRKKNPKDSNESKKSSVPAVAVESAPGTKSSAEKVEKSIKSQLCPRTAATSTGTGTNGNTTCKVDADSVPRAQLNRYPYLNEFELLVTLGMGTFARVRLCIHKPSRTFFAMKILDKAAVVKMKQVQHINNEREILVSVRHPFVIDLWATHQTERHIYMLLEYVTGGELFTLLRKAERFRPSVARFYAAEIILTLEYLHSKNIVYRDLKPENILINTDGHIKLTDFGFAKKIRDRTWTICGTPDYLAPEIIQTKGHGKAADWWALGVLIYEMLAGYPPFGADTDLGVYENILSGKLFFPAFFDKSARSLLSGLLQIDVTRRLGNLAKGAADIKNHPWFANIDWKLCLKKKLRPPVKPRLKNPGDTSNYERYPETDSFKWPKLEPWQQAQFKDF